MLTLAINTASSTTAIALFEEDQAIAEDSWPAQNSEAEKLMPAIQELLTEAGKQYADLENVVCVKGPGSFTGLRVGVTVANTISHLQKIPLHELDAFQYWWAKLEPTQTENFALLIFAGSGGVYLSSKPGEIGQMVNLPALPKALNGTPKTFGDITDPQKPDNFTEINEPFSVTIAKFLSPGSDLTQVTLIKPLYIKPPSITKSKKVIT